MVGASWRMTGSGRPQRAFITSSRSFMLFRLVVLLATGISVSGCSTFTTPRYAVSPDTNVTLKSLNTTAIGVGSFSGPAVFDSACRGAGPLAPLDGMSHTEYIRRALESELKLAGVHVDRSPG